jgi:hypothetical protein
MNPSPVAPDSVAEPYPPDLAGEELERFHDLLWASSDPEVAALYPDKIVAVHERKVWAAGDDSEVVLREAAQNAGLPQEKFILTTIFGDKLFLTDL